MSNLNTSIGPERVQVFPEPLGTVQLPGVPTSVTAFLVYSTKVGAPVNVPTMVTDLPTFVSIFGDVDDFAAIPDGYYAVEGFFNNGGTGNTAIIVNVASTSPSSFIGSAALGTGLRALDLQDIVGLLCVPGLPLSSAYLVDPAVIDYSKVIRADFGSTLSTTFSLVAVPKEISESQTDETLVSTTYISQSGSGPWVVQLTNTSVQPEIQTITCVADVSGSLAGTYFLINSANNAHDYFVWYRVSGAGSSPNLVGKTGVEINISTGDTAATVATDTYNALNLISDFSATNSISGQVVVTNTANGPCTAALDGSIPTGFSFLVNQVGNNGSVDLSSVTAGMLLENSTASYQGVIEAVDNVAKTVTVSPNPSGHFGVTTANLVMPSAVTYKNIIVNDPSKEVGWYFNSLMVLDESSSALPGELVEVSPIGHVAGVMARMDANIQIGGVSHAPAGIRYAAIAGIQGLALSLSERLDAAPLRLNFINRITSFPGSGNIIFGGYTDAGIAAIADDQLIQVIRSVQYIKGSLERGLRGFLWENFSPSTQDQIAKAVQSFLRANIYLFPAGLPEVQQFVVQSVSPTQSDLDQGLLKVVVQIKPNSAVRFIEIDLEYPIPTA